MKKRVSVICPLDKSIQLDLSSLIVFIPRYGTISVTTSIHRAGYEARLFCEIAGSTVDWDYVAKSDYVCFSVMSFSSHRSYAMVKKVRAINPNAPIIYGGSHPSVLPDESLVHCDYAVRNEGEATIVELLKTLDENGSVENVAGICYKKDGKVVYNEKREFIKELDTFADYNLVADYKPHTVFNKLMTLLPFTNARHHYPVLQTTRGCPMNCTFCFGKRELGRLYRKRKVEPIIEELKFITGTLKESNILIVDNDFCVHKKHTIEIMEEIKKTEFKRPLSLGAFTRIETARDIPFVKKLRELGIVKIFLGLESINPETLRLYNKKQRKEEMENAIKTFHDAKFMIMGAFVLGAETDTVETVRETAQFAIDHNLHQACFFCLYDFPFQKQRFNEFQSIEEHLYIHHDWRFFTSNFVVHFPRKIKPSVLQREILSANEKFYSWKKVFKDILVNVWGTLFLKVLNERLYRTMRKYILILEEMEKGYYDEDGIRIDEKLLTEKREMSSRVPLSNPSREKMGIDC